MCIFMRNTYNTELRGVANKQFFFLLNLLVCQENIIRVSNTHYLYFFITPNNSFTCLEFYYIIFFKK